MHCLTAVKSDLGMILSICLCVGLLGRIFSSLKFPFMCGDMQVHKHSRLLTFSCDVPFKLGKTTLMMKGREHKSSMSLSEMNSSSGFQWTPPEKLLRCFIWLYMQNNMAHGYFITEEMCASYCASGISRQLAMPTLLLFSPHFWTWTCCSGQNALSAPVWCWEKAVSCVFDYIILRRVSWRERTPQEGQTIRFY